MSLLISEFWLFFTGAFLIGAATLWAVTRMGWSRRFTDNEEGWRRRARTIEESWTEKLKEARAGAEVARADREAELTRLQGDLEAQRAEIERARGELEAAGSALQEHRMGLEAQRGEVEKHAAQLDAQRADVETWSAQVEEQREQLGKDLAHLESERARIREQRAEAEARAAQAAERRSEPDAQRPPAPVSPRLADELERLRLRIRDIPGLERQVRNEREERMRLQDQVDSLQGLLKETKAQSVQYRHRSDERPEGVEVQAEAGRKRDLEEREPTALEAQASKAEVQALRGRLRELERRSFTQRDDLKHIRGVSPPLERLLHSLGIVSFRQIADWEHEDIDRIDVHLGEFRGRVERDEWVAQARTLYRQKYGQEPKHEA